MNKAERYIGGGLILLLTLLTGAFTTLLTMTAYNAALLPYNSAGRYYDGVVVHHAGGELGWGLTALGGWILTFLLGWLAYRTFKPNISSKIEVPKA